MISAEAGLPDTGDSTAGIKIDHIKRRDEYASETIINTMNAADIGDKAVVFYGGAHSAKRIYENYRRDNLPPFDWKPLGSYLKDFYKNDFISLAGVTVTLNLASKSSFTDKEWQNLQVKSRILDPDIFEDPSNPDRWQGFHDAVLATPEPVFGVFYQYIPTEENLHFLFTRLKSLAPWLDQMDGSNSVKYMQNRDQFFKGIYFLKLYYGDLFEYSYWKEEHDYSGVLSKIEKLETAVSEAGGSLRQSICFDSKSVALLREYHGLMITSRIDKYQYSADSDLLPGIIAAMKQAKQIFPEDIWSEYWLNLALTKSGEFQAARDGWNLFFQNSLAFNMEFFPQAEELAAECAE